MYLGFYLLFASSEDVQTMARCVIVCPLAVNQKKPMNDPIRKPGVSDEEYSRVPSFEIFRPKLTIAGQWCGSGRYTTLFSP